MTNGLGTSLKQKLLAKDGRLAHGREILILAGAYFAYMFVRKVIIPSADTIGIENAASIIDFERALGFFWEPHLQRNALDVGKWLGTVFNYVYILTFWPMVLTTALVVYMFDRERYFYYRGLILLSFLVALIIFVLFPLAPPRMIAEVGFVDTIASLGPKWYASREAAQYYNAFAAMPSLHFAWTVVFGVLFWRSKHRLLKVLGVVYPTSTFFAITITANHYIMDAVVGGFMMLVVYILYEAIIKRRRIAARLRTILYSS